MIKDLLSKIPGYTDLRFKQLGGSAGYWERRYEDGGNSGDGSYGAAANYKAKFLNEVVRNNGISSVIEFGCGDGNQLKLAEYPEYYGIDVAQTSVDMCRRTFEGDASKTFALAPGDGRQADLALSLDVLYHLIEDEVYAEYFERLFASSKRYVVIYAFDKEPPQEIAHVRYRKFTPYIAEKFPQWRLAQAIPAPGPEFAEFYLYERT